MLSNWPQFPKLSEIKEKLPPLPFDFGSLTEEYGGKVKKIACCLVGAAVLLTCVGAGVIFGLTGCHNQAAEGEPVYVKIKPGMNARDIGAALEEHGVIKNRYAFWLMTKYKGYESGFHSGNYALHKNMPLDSVIETLLSGEVSQVKFTIPEGFGVKEIAKRLDSEGIAKEAEILQICKNFAPYDYIEANPKAHYRAEGFLFPDTYIIDPELTAKEILTVMAEDFDNRLTPAMRDKAKAKGLSVYQLVTLASLVEKEVRYEDDLRPVAQVFLKRLEIGMPLQTDASLQYLMNAPKEDVTYADTEIDSPYNTYQHMGLPPGPIASPGLAAIEAVLDPSDTDYLYFVADRQGHNHYSKTYDEHLSLVAQVR